MNAVVVPNLNGEDHLKDCLDSLLAQTEDAKIIVVDNASIDGSKKIIKKYRSVELIELDKNYGFSGGVNRGIEAAMKSGAEFVALFNNDAVADKSWLKHLVQTATQHPRVGIIAPKLIRADKRHLDSTGELYSIWGMPFPRGRNEVDEGKYDNKTEVFGASGGASLYRVSMLKQIGLFDEDFFAYFEDVDISFRAQLAGWRVLYQPKAVAYHKIGGTSSRLGDFARYHSAKNLLLLYAKNMPTKLYIKYLPLFCLQWLRWLGGSIVRGHLWTFVRGSLAALRLHFKTLSKRRDIQKSRVVSVDYIESVLYRHRPPRPPTVGSP